MKFLQTITLSRMSSGVTALVCAGFLTNAILTNNGGSPNSQENWRQSKLESRSVVAGYDQTSYSKWNVEQNGIDNTVTNSTRRSVDRAEPSIRSSEPSVLSLIRENADVAPSVSTGTDRVSVIVKRGDTLFAIAQRHGLKVTEIARLNGLEEPYTIRIGQSLYVAR